MKTLKVVQGGKSALAFTFAAAAILLFSAIHLESSPQTPPSPPRITTKTLPGATIGVEYSARLEASGGTRPYEFSATELPEGLSVRPLSDVVIGKPTVAGIFSSRFMVTDSTQPMPLTATVTLKLTVAAGPAPAHQ
jgi:hypothetical protein